MWYDRPAMTSPAPSVQCDRLGRAALWQAELACALDDPRELCRRLGLPPALASDPGDFGVRVPESFLARIPPGNPADPLLRQVLPLAEEHAAVPGFTPDPLGESALAGDTWVLSKYANRSLIVTPGPCGVHCRFCFRRHFRPTDTTRCEGELDRAVALLAADRSLHEVILSGGDPLGLDDALLGRLLERLAAVAHLRRLRIHTRFPIVIPRRVNAELVARLRSTRLTTAVAVHVNHPAEIDSDVAAALGILIDAGVPVLSQTVLLAGVNDNVETLAALLERLIDLRVTPYYLHQLDPVAGAAHFQVPEPTGVRLIQELRARLPGYAVPRYVREVPGQPAKQVLA